MLPDPLDLQNAWDRTHRNKPLSEQPEKGLVTFVKHIQRMLMPGDLILDAGCGRGRNSRYLSRLNVQVLGCDISSLALKIANSHLNSEGIPASFQTANLTHLPYPNHQFSAVICVHVLPYFFKADIIRCISEFWRVFLPGGWLYLDFLDLEDTEYGCGKQLEEHTFLDPDGVPIHFSSQQEIQDLMIRLTLKRIDRFEIKSSPTRTRVGWTIWAMKE